MYSMERFPNAFGHGILPPLLELLFPRKPHRGLLVWMVESEAELWEPPCLNLCTLTTVLFLHLGGLVHGGGVVYMSLDRAEWRGQAPLTPAFTRALSTPCKLPVALDHLSVSVGQEGTTPDKRAIPGHQKHRCVWGMLPGSDNIFSVKDEWEKSKGTREEATLQAATRPWRPMLGGARKGS